MDGGTTKRTAAPLPTEIPTPPDLSKLPSHILHSGTVETLIGHNEDLTARLMVNIRRNSILENQITQQERLNGELAHVNSSLSSQLEVLQEKDRIWREKAHQIDDRQELFQDRIRELDAKLRYSEEANGRLRASARFQRRVKRWVQPLITKLRTDLATEAKARFSSEAQLSDLRARVDEITREARASEGKHLRDQTKLVEQYEARIAAIPGLRDKALRFDELSIKRVELENEVVSLERTLLDRETKLLAEVSSLRDDLARYRKEAKDAIQENEELKNELRARESAIEATSQNFDRLQDQFESLQTVWAESQKRLEAAKVQHETLNRLNQELSRQLKENRQNQSHSSADSGLRVVGGPMTAAVVAAPLRATRSQAKDEGAAAADSAPSL